MIDVVRKEYEPRMQRLDRRAANVIFRHPDVLPGSMHAVFQGQRLTGFACIVKGPGVFRHLVLALRPSITEEDFTELVRAEIDHFRKNAGKEGRKKPILRFFVKETDGNAEAVFRSFGFRKKDEMLLMERTTEGLVPPGVTLPPPDSRFIRCNYFASPFRENYLHWTEEAYGMADRDGEMCYLLRERSAWLIAAREGNDPAAFVTVYPDGKGVYRTENVFTRPEYRRRGLMEELLNDIALRFAERGAKTLRLSVYRGNEAARALYEKIGYREVAAFSELWLMR